MIAQGTPCALGAEAVLMKGGHGTGEICVDLLISGAGITRLTAPRLATRNTHGTAARCRPRLRRGWRRAWRSDAVGRAHRYLQGAIAAADGLGRGVWPRARASFSRGLAQWLT
jgi:hydroxymethylpyrimidine/phosphomethylpyrimidine kinase